MHAHTLCNHTTGLLVNFAARHWTLDSLRKEYGSSELLVQLMSTRAGQQEKHVRRMELANFMDYMRVQKDENPAYVFDAAFGVTCPAMLEAYSVPKMFELDFLEGFGK